MSLRNYLKGIADALRDNGAYSDQEDGKINAQEFSNKIYEIAEHKYSAGMAEGYNRGQEVGYENGHEEGYHQGEAEGYKQGALDVSPQENAYGEAIGITDISPVEHNMEVKVSGVEDISTVKLYKQGKNWLSVGFVIGNFTTSGLNTTNKTVLSSYGFYLKAGTYAINGLGSDYNFFVNGMSTPTKTNGYQTLHYSNNSFKIPEDGLYNIQFNKKSGAIEVDIESLKFQVELGTTPTEYEPYIEPTVYDVNADGTVEGVTSLYPSTTLYTDTQGAVIDCTYYQDGKKVKENLTNKVSSIESVTEEVTE